jgi:hypothetical protein
MLPALLIFDVAHVFFDVAQPTAAALDLTTPFLSASALWDLDATTSVLGLLTEAGWSAEPGVSSQHVGVS